MFARRIRAKKKPHRPEFDRAAEVHLVVQLREAFEIGKKTRDSQLRGPVDDNAGGGRTDVVHHQHNRVLEIGIGQLGASDEEDCR